MGACRLGVGAGRCWMRSWVWPKGGWGSSLGVGVLGMDYGDFEVARGVVKVCGACGSRSLARVLDNAVDILLVAVALNRGCGLVTTDRRLV